MKGGALKLLVFSDLHLDTPFAWAGAHLARRRRLALREALTRICELASTERVDAVLCAGDLYEHERFQPDTVAFVADTLNAVDVPVYLAPGNHDWYGHASLYQQARFASNIHVFTEDYLTPIELVEGVTLWGAAHRAPANTDGFLDDFAVDRDGINLALFHGSEQGALGWQENGKRPHAPFREGQIAEAGLVHAFCGHFHAPRHKDLLTYPGNPEPLAFGEAGDRGAVIAEVSPTGAVSRTTHCVSTTRVHDVNVELRDVTHSGHIQEQVAAAVAPLVGIVRVTLTGEVAPDVQVDLGDLRSVAPHLEALVPQLGEVSVAYDFEALAGESTVRGQFVRDVQTAPELDEATRRRILITGLRALAGRNDLEVH